jgi:hypothetical protein
MVMGMAIGEVAEIIWHSSLTILVGFGRRIAASSKSSAWHQFGLKRRT